MDAGRKYRPSDVTVLRNLHLVQGILFLLLGFAGVLFQLIFIGPSGVGFGWGAVCGGLFFVNIAIAYGLWTLRRWARAMAIVFAIIGLLAFSVSLLFPIALAVSLLGTIISMFILWYLSKPEVVRAFGAR